MIVGSSSPTPVRLSRGETFHSRKASSAAGLSASGPERAVKPAVEILRLEQHRHAVVIGLHPGAGTRHDDRAGQHPSPVAGSIQRSQSPAKASNGEPSAAVKRCGCFGPFAPVHSKKPHAGMMQRRSLKASRNIGLSATDSARALKVAGTSLGAFSTRPGPGPSASAPARACRP